MAPDMQYMLIINRVAELQEEATNHRRARAAMRGDQDGVRGHNRLRAGLRKFRTS